MQFGRAVRKDGNHDPVMEGTMDTNNTEEKWVNIEDVAEHLSVSQDTVRTWIKAGKLPVYKAGKRYKFKLSEVDAWVREGKI